MSPEVFEPPDRWIQEEINIILEARHLAEFLKIDVPAALTMLQSDDRQIKAQAYHYRGLMNIVNDAREQRAKEKR